MSSGVGLGGKCWVFEKGTSEGGFDSQNVGIVSAVEPVIHFFVDVVQLV